MDLVGLEILDKNELNVFSDGRLIYVYDVHSELRGKQNITFELELPVLYENNKEIAYPFGVDWHIQWFDEVYYLNTVKPSGVKNNEKRTIKYTLVFEGLSNKLDNVLIRNFARVYVDENHDGFADDDEIITDIELSSTPAFYGNIYDFVAYIRKNLNYIYGYLNDEYQTVGGNKTVIPKYLIKFANIDYKQNGKLIAENFLEIEAAESNTITHKYSTSDRVSIELDGLSLLEALKKLNENFTYKEVINNNTEDVGYSFSFGTIDLYSDGGLVKTDTNEKYTIPCVIINPPSSYVRDSSGNAVVFEYGGLTKDGGLLEITRTTDENKVANRIYGKGSSENLPVNYFRIYENEAIEGQAEDGQKYFKTQEELSQKVTNPDPTKVYLVEDEEFVNVYDKWVWTRDEALILTASTSDETSVKIAENNTLPNVATGESISDIYLIQDNLDSSKYYAYWYNSLELQWESLGLWNKDGLMWGGTEQKTEPDFVSFFDSGDSSKEIEQSEVIVFIRKGANVTTQDNKVYAYVSEDGGTYTCEYKKKYYGLGWIPQGYMTYERVNPFPKHISSITNLMPECFRAYLAGWRYGYFYAKDNNNTAQNLNLTEVDTDDLIETVTVLPTTATANKIYRKKDVFYLVYIYTKDENGNLTVPILLGIYDDNTKGYFKKGLKDFAIGMTESAGVYDYTNCGKIYKPTNYYEDEELINLYGVIEKKEDFSDIKPSIVGQYISGLGRLDEVVDVYIPSNGYYWKDNQYINTIDGRRYNTQVPNLYIPQIMDGEMIISTGDFRVQTVNKNIYRTLFRDVSSVSNYIYRLNTDTILSEEVDLSNVDFSVRSAMVLDMRVRGNIVLKKDAVYNGNTAQDFYFPCISYDVVIPLYYRVLRKEENGNTFEEISSKKLLGTLKKKVTYGIKFVKDGVEYSIKTPAKERVADGLWIDGFVYEYKDEGVHKEVVYFSNGSTLFIQNNHPSTNITSKNGWKKYIAKQYGAAGWTREEEDGFTMEYDIVEEDYTESLNDDYYIEERGIYKVELSTQKNIMGYVNSVINAQSYVNRLYCPMIVKHFVDNNSNVRFEVGQVGKINSVLDIYEIWDYTTKEFFVWVKDIKFNPLLPAFQGEQAPSITFSTGALAGIDNKFAISTVHCDGFIKAEGERAVNTELSEDTPTITGNVPSKYMMALKYVESGLTDTNDNQSIFYTLPQNNVQPKAKDLFIINDVRYPHNPYTYSAERKLAEELKKKTDQNVRYTYAVVFDNICRQKKGINYNLLKVGNRIYIRNNSLVTTYRQGTVYADKYSFVIQQVSVKRSENSLYDTYTLVLGNEKRYYKNTLRDFNSLSNSRMLGGDLAIAINPPSVSPNVLSEDVRVSLQYNRQDTQITSLNKNFNTLNILSQGLEKRVTDLENSEGTYRKYDIVLPVTEKDEYKMVEHTKRYPPQLLCIREDGKRIEIMAEYSSENTLLLTWNERFNGKIYII